VATVRCKFFLQNIGLKYARASGRRAPRLGGNMFENSKRKALFVFNLLCFVGFMSFCEDINTMRNWNDINNLATLAAGSLIVVESGLLLYGMNFPESSDWTGIKNNGLAISDIILGGTLIYYSFSQKTYSNDLLYYLVISSLLVTHGYRDLEYLGKTNNPFIANTPLFILNNVRIGLLGTSLAMNIEIPIN
jgi:hypothetical protein